MAYSDSDIKQLKELKSFLVTTFNGAYVNGFKIDGSVEVLQKIIDDSESTISETNRLNKADELNEQFESMHNYRLNRMRDLKVSLHNELKDCIDAGGNPIAFVEVLSALVEAIIDTRLAEKC